MNTKNNKTLSDTIKEAAQKPYIKGPLLGAGVMTAVTPLLNWTNHVTNDKKMLIRYAMGGASQYALSSAPTYGMVFMAKKILESSSNKNTPTYDFATSFLARSLSGLVYTPFSAIAQNQQFTKLPSATTIKKMFTHNGIKSFFRGASVTGVQEGTWSTIYLTAVPFLVKHLQSKGMEKKKAEGISCVAIAGTYGFLSTPLNQLRSRKQLGLTEPAPTKSYAENLGEIWRKNPTATNQQRLSSLFKGVVPRTITTTVAAGIIVKGSELYDQVVKPSPSA